MSENEREDDRENERDDSDEAAWLLARERGQPGPIVSDATAARYARLQSMIEDLPAAPGGARARAGWQQDVLAAIDEMEARVESSRNQVPGQVPVQPSVEAPVEAAIQAPAKAPIGEAGELEVAGQVQPTDNAVPKRRSTRPARWAAASAIVATAAAVAILLAVRRHRGEVDAPTVAYEVDAPTIVYEVDTGSRLHRGDDPSVGDTLIVRAVVQGRGELRVYDGAGNEQAHCAAPAPGCAVERSGNRTTLRLTMRLRELGALRAVLFAAPLGGKSGGIDADVEAAMRAGIALIPRDLVEVR